MRSPRGQRSADSTGCEGIRKHDDQLQAHCHLRPCLCWGGVLNWAQRRFELYRTVYFYLKQNRIQYSQSDSGVVIYSFSALAYSNRIFTFLIISIYEDISQAAGPISFCPRKVRQEATAMFVA